MHLRNRRDPELSVPMHQDFGPAPVFIRIRDRLRAGFGEKTELIQRNMSYRQQALRRRTGIPMPYALDVLKGKRPA